MCARSSQTQRRYARYNQQAMTSDADGRWIACDESGNDGENLIARTPVFVSGSVRLDDAAAASVVRALSTAVSSRQRTAEIKFSDFDSPQGVSALAWATGRGGPLRGRAHVYVADKRYVAAG